VMLIAIRPLENRFIRNRKFRRHDDPPIDERSTEPLT